MAGPGLKITKELIVDPTPPSPLTSYMTFDLQASGLAMSGLQEGILWTITDKGGPNKAM